MAIRTLPLADAESFLGDALAAAYEEGHAAARRDWALGERDIRRATVERIRERLHKIPNPHGDGSFPATAIYDILDEEAAR